MLTPAYGMRVASAGIGAIVAGVTSGLVRIVLVAPKGRLAIALPEHLPMAVLMPNLLTQAGEGIADEGLVHGGWSIRRIDGKSIDLSRTLAAQDLRDGEILHLVPRRDEWPEPAYDDIVDAVAAGARQQGAVWHPGATRLAGLAAAGVLSVLATVQVLFAGPPWVLPAMAALLFATLLMIAGIALSRAFGDSVAGSVLGVASLPAAFAAGLLVLGGDEQLTALGAPHLVVGSTLLFVAGLLGYVGVADGRWLFVAGAVTGLIGMLGGVLALTPMGAADSAAIVVSLIVVLGPLAPLLGVRLGKVPMPAIPRTVADLEKDDAVPPTEEIYRGVARGDTILTGALIGSAVVVVAVQPALLSADDMFAAPLLGVAGAALLLRARLFVAVRHRVPLLVGGLSCLTGLAVMSLGVSAIGRLASGLALLVAAFLATAAGLRYGHRRPSVYLGRLADVLDVLLVIAVIPLACGVAGVFDLMRGLGG